MQRAVILAIGDELLSGETVDSNSSYLDGLLEARGWSVVRHMTVADEEADIAEAFTEAAQRGALVLSTGGLGPTQDDLTMAGLARALGCPLVLHEPTLEFIKARFRSFGRAMTPNNERQARVPASGEVLVNEAGTAPGFTAELHGARVFLMPGVPREVRWLMKHQIMPRLPAGPQPRTRRTVKVVGVGESRLEHDILAVVAAHPEVRFGYRTLGMENHVKLVADGEGREARLAAAEADLRGVLGTRIYGVDDADLDQVVGAALGAAGQTVAVAESCTGGWVAKRITDISGSSAYFLGGVVAYADRVKTTLLGVPEPLLAEHGAVSEPVVRAMAEGVRARLGADWGLATTGIAGPTGGTPEKPVGLVWMAISGPSGTTSAKVQFPGNREQVRMGTATAVLDALRRRLADPGAGLLA
jgi:nicotinamide-nucleotide amidase